MRRHFDSCNGAAESFVSCIPLLGGASFVVIEASSVVPQAGSVATSVSRHPWNHRPSPMRRQRGSGRCVGKGKPIVRLVAASFVMPCRAGDSIGQPSSSFVSVVGSVRSNVGDISPPNTRDKLRASNTLNARQLHPLVGRPRRSTAGHGPHSGTREYPRQLASTPFP
jgi:hypothetical protein